MPTPRRRATTTAARPPIDARTPTTHEDDWDAYPGEPGDQPLPRRERRRLLNRRSAALFAVLACAVGFYAGVRVEKNQLSSSTVTLGTTGTGTGTGRAGAAGASRSGLAALFAGRAGGAGGAGGSSATGATGATGSTGSGGFGGFTGAGGANASIGTVASINGATVYLTETSGNTVKVKLASSTKVSKTQPVSHTAIRPGDTLVVTGVTGSDATVTAASVTDSGTGRSAGSSSSGASSSSGGSGSAVGSLFSSGG